MIRAIPGLRFGWAIFSYGNLGPIFVWDFPTLCQERRYFCLYLFIYLYSWVARDVIIFENPKLEIHQIYYLHQA